MEGRGQFSRGKVVEAIPTVSKAKFSGISYGMFRAATEFGKFSFINGEGI